MPNANSEFMFWVHSFNREQTQNNKKNPPVPPWWTSRCNTSCRHWVCRSARPQIIKTTNRKTSRLLYYSMAETTFLLERPSDESTPTGLTVNSTTEPTRARTMYKHWSAWRVTACAFTELKLKHRYRSRRCKQVWLLNASRQKEKHKFGMHFKASNKKSHVNIFGPLFQNKKRALYNT